MIPDVEKEVAEITFRGTLAAGGGKAVTMDNIFHFRRTTVLQDLVKDHVQAGFQTAIGDIILLAMSSQFTQSANIVRMIDDSEDYAQSFTQAGVGAIAGDRLPSDEVVTLPMRCNVRGRWAMGRKHFGGIAESSTLADVLTAGAIVLWGAVATAILTGFADADGSFWVPCIFSREHSVSVVNPTDLEINDVSAVLLNKNISRFKRRRQKTIR